MIYISFAAQLINCSLGTRKQLKHCQCVILKRFYYEFNRKDFFFGTICFRNFYTPIGLKFINKIKSDLHMEVDQIKL